MEFRRLRRIWLFSWDLLVSIHLAATDSTPGQLRGRACFWCWQSDRLFTVCCDRTAKGQNGGSWSPNNVVATNSRRAGQSHRFVLSWRRTLQRRKTPAAFLAEQCLGRLRPDGDNLLKVLFQPGTNVVMVAG